MKRMKWLVVAAALALSACSGGNNGNNGETNNGTSNNGGMDAGNNGAMPDVDNTGVEYADEYETKFDSLAFSNQPGNQLNTLLANNLDTDLEFPIIVLLELTQFDLDAGTLVLQGGSGVKTETEGEFEWDPDTELSDGTQGTLDAASGEFSAEIEYFGFVATFKFENDVSKTVIPIRNLAIGGTLDLSEDGSTASVVGGTLEGIVTKEEGDTTMITLTPGGNPVSLTQLFKEGTLNWDTTTNAEVAPGEGDAWFMKGTYTAAPTNIAD